MSTPTPKLEFDPNLLFDWRVLNGALLYVRVVKTSYGYQVEAVDIKTNQLYILGTLAG